MDQHHSVDRRSPGPFPESARTSSLAASATDSPGQKVPGTLGCAGILYQNKRPARNEKERPNRVSLSEVANPKLNGLGDESTDPAYTQPDKPKEQAKKAPITPVGSSVCSATHPLPNQPASAEPTSISHRCLWADT